METDEALREERLCHTVMILALFCRGLPLSCPPAPLRSDLDPIDQDVGETFPLQKTNDATALFWWRIKEEVGSLVLLYAALAKSS